jgi:hypothetical protein
MVAFSSSDAILICPSMICFAFWKICDRMSIYMHTDSGRAIMPDVEAQP